MIIISRFALATVAASLFSLTRVLVVAVDYHIAVGTPAVTANGFDETTDSAEITMAFVLNDGAGVTTTNVACNIYGVTAGTPDQCNTGTAITEITATHTLTANDLSVDVDVSLANIATSSAWSYDAATKVGTINFCNRCATTDPTSGQEIAYAETLATVTVTMQEDLPASFTASVNEESATSETKDALAATYEVTAIKCNDAKAEDTTALAQGDYLQICVSFAHAGVDCDHFQTVDLAGSAGGTLSVVANGAIVNSALTVAGHVSGAASPDGTCVAKTQFPSAMIPADGTPGTITITGAVVLHFGRRKLRVQLGTDEQRALQVNDDEVGVDFELNAGVQKSADAPFGASSAAASGTTAGAALLGAAAALILAA